MKRLDTRSKLKSPTALTVCLFAFLLTTFLLSKDPEELEYRILKDSWSEQSGNRFAYNICSLPSSYQETEERGLPLAHRTWIAEEEQTVRNCLPEDGYKQMNESASDIFHSEESQVCSKLFLGERLTEKEKSYSSKLSGKQLSQSFPELIDNSNNCSWASNEFSNNFYVTEKERSFPIAYAININHSPHQILRFLKSIYRPHNIYCLHFDRKSSHAFKQVFFNLATCLGNVLIPRRIEDVYRGWYTLIEAHYSCFSDLVLARGKYPWRYVITLCGKELPLRTNAEIVAMLEPLNGTSSVQTVGDDGVDDFKYKWKWTLNRVTGWITRKDSPLPPIPYGLKVYKSWAYVALSHQFVQYLLCSPEATALRNYMKDVRIPEENIYATLFMRPNTPGGYRPEYEDRIFPVFSCIWLDGDHHGPWKRLQMMLYRGMFCSGTSIHNICMVGANDLHKLSFRPGVEGYVDIDTYLETGGGVQYYSGPDRGPLFHNKYIMESDSTAMKCMETELHRRNVMEYAKECL